MIHIDQFFVTINKELIIKMLFRVKLKKKLSAILFI